MGDGLCLAGCLGLPRGDRSSPGGRLGRRNGVRRLREEELPGGAGALPESSRAKATAAWQFGRACFDLAEFATNNTERASLAEQGIAACRQRDRARVQFGPGPLLPRHESRATGTDERTGRAQARGPDGARIHPGARPGRAVRLGRARSQPGAALPRRPRPRQRRKPHAGHGNI